MSFSSLAILNCGSFIIGILMPTEHEASVRCGRKLKLESQCHKPLSTLYICEESAPKEEPQTCATSPEACWISPPKRSAAATFQCSSLLSVARRSRPAKTPDKQRSHGLSCELCLLSIAASPLFWALGPQTSSLVVPVKAEWSRKGDGIDIDGTIDVQTSFPPRRSWSVSPTDDEEEIGSFAPELYHVKWNVRTVPQVIKRVTRDKFEDSWCISLKNNVVSHMENIG
ncbi:hypothetical protein EJB05_13449, partial [Eragrostis curvula]